MKKIVDSILNYKYLHLIIGIMFLIGSVLLFISAFSQFIWVLWLWCGISGLINHRNYRKVDDSK